MEKFIKSILGQWKIVSESTKLKKAKFEERVDDPELRRYIRTVRAENKTDPMQGRGRLVDSSTPRQEARQRVAAAQRAKRTPGMIKSQETVILSKSGQWTLLEKAVWEDAPHIQPEDCICGTKSDKHHYSCVDNDSGGGGDGGGDPHAANNSRFRGLFGNLNQAVKNQDPHRIDHYKGKIKQFALSLPKEGIDLGYLGKLRESQERLPAVSPKHRRIGSGHGRAINHDDMGEIINHHFGDAGDLKELHGKIGDEGLETMIRTMGVNGVHSSSGYSPVSFKNAKVHDDLTTLANPGKQSMFDDAPDFLHTPRDPKLQKDVDTTFDTLRYTGRGLKEHEDAVVKRSVDWLRRHHQKKTP